MTDYSTLIDKSARLLEERGYKQITSVSDRQERGKGITYTKFKTDDAESLEEHTFFVRCKEYVYEGLAPFGKEHVKDAKRNDAWLVIYFDDGEGFHVFDPAQVHRDGEETTGRSKRSDARKWIEVTLDDGVALDEFEAGQRPTSSRLSGSGSTTETKRTSLFDYGGDS